MNRARNTQRMRAAKDRLKQNSNPWALVTAQARNLVAAVSVRLSRVVGPSERRHLPGVGHEDSE